MVNLIPTTSNGIHLTTPSLSRAHFKEINKASTDVIYCVALPELSLGYIP